jgi:3-hydroxyacyl-[acyl-carrier-protein] dehydratase
MFEGNLYHINNLDFIENSITANISINNEHEIFKGHFPGNPILPGVCSLQIIKEIISKSVNLNLTLIHADNIKFLAVVNPDENNNIDLNISIISRNEHTIITASQMKSGDIIILKMKGTYKCSAPTI